MSRISCNVIQDMIPLYVEDMCSEETKQMVQEHIEECETCRNMLAVASNPLEMEGVLQSKKEEKFENAEWEIYKKIHHAVFKKVAKRTAMVVIPIVCLFLVVNTLWEKPLFDVSYDKAGFRIEESEKSLNISFFMDDFDCEMEGNVLVLTGKSSMQMRWESARSNQRFAFYYAKGDVEKVVYREESGVEHLLWSIEEKPIKMYELDDTSLFLDENNMRFEFVYDTFENVDYDGNYKIEGNRIVAVSDDGSQRFVFKIVGDYTLRFVQEDSVISDEENIQIRDGSEFVYYE